MNIEIRKAREKDALAISIVHVYTWKTTYCGLIPEEALDALLSELPQRAEKMRHRILEEDTVLAATADDTVVAFCTYGPSRNKDFSAAGEIYALYCLKGFHGKGIGKALFLAAVQELVRQGYQTMILNCLKGNSSLQFYQHMGGTVIGEREDTFSGGILHEDIVFYKELDKIMERKTKKKSSGA